MFYEIKSEEWNVLFNTMEIDAIKLVTYDEDKACLYVIRDGDVLPVAQGDVEDIEYEYEKLKTHLLKMDKE